MLHNFQGPINVCVFGASGGIGAALTAALANDPKVATVLAGARKIDGIMPYAKVCRFAFDLLDEESIVDAAQIVAAKGPLHLIIIATGLLHDSDRLKPERAAKMQTGDAYTHAFATNAIGPALIGKHFLPLLAREGRTVFAALSAKVGSIEDNRLGGWHAYRASKAALNMIVRNFAIEMAILNKEALAITLHPGTVDTALSAPFQRGVATTKLFTPDYAARQLLTVIDGLSMEDSGKLFGWDGERIPF